MCSPLCLQVAYSPLHTWSHRIIGRNACRTSPDGVGETTDTGGGGRCKTQPSSQFLSTKPCCVFSHCESSITQEDCQQQEIHNNLIWGFFRADWSVILLTFESRTVCFSGGHFRLRHMQTWNSVWKWSGSKFSVNNVLQNNQFWHATSQSVMNGINSFCWIQMCLYYFTLHSKNTRVSRDPEKGPLGPNSIPSTMTRKSVKLTNNGVRLTQLRVIFRVKLTDFRVIVDPEWSLAPMDPFPGHADPGVFRVCLNWEASMEGGLDIPSRVYFEWSTQVWNVLSGRSLWKITPIFSFLPF